MDENNFQHWKQQSLSKIDLSKKGSVDEEISDIVAFLNELPNYFTTSSCSGRIIVVDGVSVSLDVQKKDCPWLLVTHQKVHTADVLTCLESARGDAVFKFEPFVLHVQCKHLRDAQLLHSVAINSGFRNSGITVGKKGKIIMAVRSTHCLEVPLTHKGRLLVNEDYIDFLVDVANQKMQENLRRIKRFYECLQSAVCSAKCCTPCPDVMKGTSVYRRRRKRMQDCSHETLSESNRGSTSTDEDDGLASGLGLFT